MRCDAIWVKSKPCNALPCSALLVSSTPLNSVPQRRPRTQDALASSSGAALLVTAARDGRCFLWHRKPSGEGGGDGGMGEEFEVLETIAGEDDETEGEDAKGKAKAKATAADPASGWSAVTELVAPCIKEHSGWRYKKARWLCGAACFSSDGLRVYTATSSNKTPAFLTEFRCETLSSIARASAAASAAASGAPASGAGGGVSAASSKAATPADVRHALLGFLGRGGDRATAAISAAWVPSATSKLSEGMVSSLAPLDEADTMLIKCLGPSEDDAGTGHSEDIDVATFMRDRMRDGYASWLGAGTATGEVLLLHFFAYPRKRHSRAV